MQSRIKPQMSSDNSGFKYTPCQKKDSPLRREVEEIFGCAQRTVSEPLLISMLVAAQRMGGLQTLHRRLHSQTQACNSTSVIRQEPFSLHTVSNATFSSNPTSMYKKKLFFDDNAHFHRGMVLKDKLLRCCTYCSRDASEHEMIAVRFSVPFVGARNTNCNTF